MKKQLTILLMIVSMIFSCSVLNEQAHAETEVSGNITEDITWTLENSPYIVTGTVQVLESVKLTIEPGVIVKFNTDAGLTIGGEFIAIGLESQKIYFTSSQSNPYADDWNNIKFINTAVDAVIDSNKNYLSGTIIKNSVIQYGGNNNTDIISISEVSPFIESNIISNGRHGIFNEGNDTVIKNNIIQDNSYDGIRNYRSNVVITNNITKNNGWYGIFTEGSNCLIKDNIATNNSLGGIYEYGGSDNIISGNMVKENSIFGIGISGINTVVENNNVEGNGGHGIKFFSGQNITIINNTIVNNTGDGLYNKRAKNVIITKNLIKNNYINGISIGYAYGGDGGPCGNIAEFIYNNIYSNIQYNFHNGYIDDINTSNNYWGTINTTEIDEKIYDYYDNISYGKVNYEPYALAELKFDGTDTFSQPLTCTSWTYSDWDTCINGQQIRTIISSQPANCAGGNPILNQSCDSTPLCEENNWTSTLSPTICPSNGQQTKTWNKIGQCQEGVSHPAEETVSCNYQTPTCDDFTYSDWGSCGSSGTQSRTMLSSSPSGCAGGNPILNQSCAVQSTVCVSWTYSNWSSCANGWQTRTISSSSPTNCINGNPVLSQSCQNETDNEDDAEITTQPETSESNPEETSTEISDGDIIQCQNSSNPSAVYIVKIVGDIKYIRHIVSLDIFNYYKHLKWGNLKQVDSLDDYSLSGWVRYNTGPNGTAGPTDEVYEINGDQTRHWINMTAEDFLTHGGSEPAIFNINQGELNLYIAGPDVMSL